MGSGVDCLETGARYVADSRNGERSRSSGAQDVLFLHMYIWYLMGFFFGVLYQKVTVMLLVNYIHSASEKCERGDELVIHSSVDIEQPFPV